MAERRGGGGGTSGVPEVDYRWSEAAPLAAAADSEQRRVRRASWFPT